MIKDNQKIKNIMESVKKHWNTNSKLFTLIFVVALMITLPVYFISPYMDTYCHEVSGYAQITESFIGGERVVSAIMFFVASVFHLSFTSLAFISALFATIFLTLAVLKVYLVMSENIEGKIKKLFILIAAFVTFYSPFIIELYMFDEAMIMCLGILFSVLAAKKINEDNLKSYFLGFIYVVLSVLSYQGSVCFLIPILLLFAVKKTTDNNKEDILNVVKKLFFAGLFYGIAFFIDLFVVMLGGALFDAATDKVGHIDLLKNISLIRTYLLPLALNTLYGYINVKLFYIITFIIGGFSIVGIVQNKNKLFNSLILIGVVMSAVLMPLVPNLVMNSDLNYFDARQALTIVALPGMMALLVLTKFTLSNKCLNYIFAFVLVVCLSIFSYLYFVNLKQDLDRYNQDMKYLEKIQLAINKYEKKNDVKVKHIYWATDENSAEFYNANYDNLTSLRMVSRGGWAMSCAVNAYGGKDYKITYSKMDDKTYKKLFKNKDYDSFDLEQLYFEDDKLYLLVY